MNEYSLVCLFTCEPNRMPFLSEVKYSLDRNHCHVLEKCCLRSQKQMLYSLSVGIGQPGELHMLEFIFSSHSAN